MRVALFILVGLVVAAAAIAVWVYLSVCGMGPHHPHGLC